jgi:hypothetical protein
MIRLAPILCLVVLASCIGGPPEDPGLTGPTGRVSDGSSYQSIKVRDVWRMDLNARSLKLVSAALTWGKTARYDPVQFEGYYNSAQNVTTIGVFGNVTTSTDYGTTIRNGYYVTWQQTGRLNTDFPASPWKLVDVDVMDQQY